LLGITQDTDIIIDYSRPIEDIFADATTSIIKQEQNLNILCMQTNLFAPHQENRLPRCELPSWVPHFECGVDLRELNTFHFAYDSQRYKGGGPLKALPDRIKVQNTRALRIDGCFYGTVIYASSRFPISFWSDDEVGENLVDLKAVVDRTIDCSNEAFWRTLVMDAYPIGTGLLGRIERVPEARRNLLADLNTALTSSAPVWMLEHLRPLLDAKAFCLTTKGHMAMVHGDVEVGDHVFVARGATNPFILRPFANDDTFSELQNRLGTSTFYEFVGGSYVHGIMDGEVLAYMDKLGVHEETIYLI
jgi:hypothetical protein